MNRSLALASILAATLAAAPAYAGKAKTEAADKGLGAAVLSAAVDIDGTLLSGSGVAYVDRVQAGQFDIELVRNIEGCNVVANVGLPVNTIAPVGFAIPRTSNPTGLRVRTYDASGNDADRPFQVIVFCAK